MKQKTTVLYNVMFPIWFFFLWPSLLWLFILPANFLIDSIVLRLSARYCHIEPRLMVWKKTILRIWVIGFLSDLIGAGFLLGLDVLVGYALPQWNTVLFPGTSLLALPGVILAGFLIYFLNKKFSFRKCNFLWPEQIQKLCLALAVFTAPYTMMIPLYG